VLFPGSREEIPFFFLFLKVPPPTLVLVRGIFFSITTFAVMVFVIGVFFFFFHWLLAFCAASTAGIFFTLRLGSDFSFSLRLKAFFHTRWRIPGDCLFFPPPYKNGRSSPLGRTSFFSSRGRLSPLTIPCFFFLGPPAGHLFCLPSLGPWFVRGFPSRLEAVSSLRATADFFFVDRELPSGSCSEQRIGPGRPALSFSLPGRRQQSSFGARRFSVRCASPNPPPLPPLFPQRLMPLFAFFACLDVRCPFLEIIDSFFHMNPENAPCRRMALQVRYSP